MAKASIITLLTDFGLRDPYVAQMKGVILSICPRALLVDISHDVAPQDVLEAAFMLSQAAPFFPKGTVHLAVVDPGVGTGRQILAARMHDQIFLAPDNGLLTFVASAWPMEELVVVRDPAFLTPLGAAMTFQGRDTFAPLAAHILNGLELRRLGPQPETYKHLDLPTASSEQRSIRGQVIYIDRFGNLISNITMAAVQERWSELDLLQVTCAGRLVGPLHGTYAHVDEGQPVAVFNSMRLLEVAVNQGRASDFCNAAIGDEIVIGEM